MTKQSRGILRIGTSNIVVPGNKQSLPAEFQDKSRLNFYSSMFNTLEVNSSFYKVPMLKTFEKWSLDVPESFKFTVKLWKEITHVKNLGADLKNIDIFLKAASGIGDKKGCMLVQFPGKITFEYYSQLEEILMGLVRNEDLNNWQIAIEFRNPTWYVSETYELLDEHGVSLVLHDIPKSRNAQLNTAAPFVYIRYHGPTGDYRGSYSNDFLLQESNKISRWLKSGKDVYVYFNNTIGSALENAITLKQMAAE